MVKSKLKWTVNTAFSEVGKGGKVVGGNKELIWQWGWNYPYYAVASHHGNVN